MVGDEPKTRETRGQRRRHSWGAKDDRERERGRGRERERERGRETWRADDERDTRIKKNKGRNVGEEDEQK